MVKFRILGSKGSGKSFGLLATEATFNLVLLLLLSSFMGVQPPDCTALIGQPIITLNQWPRIVIIGEGKKKPPGAHIWLVSKLKLWFCFAHLGEGEKHHPLLFDWRAYQWNFIIVSWLCVTPSVEKPSSFNHSNPGSTLTFQMNYFRALKIKITIKTYKKIYN